MGYACDRIHDQMNDYERMAKVIRYLDGIHPARPSLAQIAHETGLSMAHFHRIFVRRAGVTPKDFLQCLTLTRAKELLCQGKSVLDTALSSGLSGPGRLHDLCVNLEAATPGEIKSKGQGLNIIAGFSESPFGEIFIAESQRGICHLSFPDGDKEGALIDLQTIWPKSVIKMNHARAKQIASMIFPRLREEAITVVKKVSSSIENKNQGGQRHLRAYVKGADFQVRVWRALLAVSEGNLTSYGTLAKTIGRPTACRAVGTAVGANPIAYLIPCHRVIRETGVIGHYHWHAERKRAMLMYETA